MRKIILTILLITAYASSYSQDTLSYTREKAVADSIWLDNHLKTPEGKYFDELSKYVIDIKKRITNYDIEKGDPDIKAYFIMYEPYKSDSNEDKVKRISAIYLEDVIFYSINMPSRRRESVIYYKEEKPIIKPIKYLEELKKYGELIDWEEFIKDIPNEDFEKLFKRDFLGEKLYMIDKNHIGKDSVKIYPTNYNSWGLSGNIYFRVEERRNKKYNIVPPEETKNWVIVF